jgi:hypothetical protein
MAVLEGYAYWPFVTTPNTKYTPEYSVNLVVSADVADSFRQRGFTIKDMDEGPALIIRRKVNGPDGKAMQVLDLVEYGSSAPDGSEFEIEDEAGNEL